MKTMIVSALLATTLAAQSWAASVPDVRGMELSAAMSAISAAGFKINHDGGDGYKVTFYPGPPVYICGNDEISPSMKRFRKVMAMKPEPFSELTAGATISLESNWENEQVGKPPRCPSGVQQKLIP